MTSCFAYLDDVTLPKWGVLLKERICSQRSKFFPFRADLNLEGSQKGKYEERVASPESVHIQLKS